MLELRQRPLLPLWEKVDRRDSAETDEGCSRERHRLTPLEHPSSVAFGDTFSHKGRRRSRAPHPPFGHLLPVNGEKG
ncbi:hypothetical protein MPLDJ20_60285 [Mesorhizobium plurifarium]|uniref:Uncharacterized protein n=1 Tax=Mesorhizobium plurifarium TaxID=69974 RepID=A0A090FI93_MESPL|nr:hypothetical protein MPLDJ20_60285 [Mesorhizobium plurifarium]